MRYFLTAVYESSGILVCFNGSGLYSAKAALFTGMPGSSWAFCICTETESGSACSFTVICEYSLFWEIELDIGKGSPCPGVPAICSKLEKPLPYRAILSPAFLNGNRPVFRSFVNESAMNFLPRLSFEPLPLFLGTLRLLDGDPSETPILPSFIYTTNYFRINKSKCLQQLQDCSRAGGPVQCFAQYPLLPCWCFRLMSSTF